MMSLLEKLFSKNSMRPEKSTEEESRDGKQAEILLRDGIFSKVVTEMRTNLHEGWAKCPLRDHEGQQQLHLMQHLLEKLVKKIEDAYLLGQAAQAKLDSERKK